jgi:hypothetical protein
MRQRGDYSRPEPKCEALQERLETEAASQPTASASFFSSDCKRKDPARYGNTVAWLQGVRGKNLTSVNPGAGDGIKGVDDPSSIDVRQPAMSLRNTGQLQTNITRVKAADGYCWTKQRNRKSTALRH